VNSIENAVSDKDIVFVAVPTPHNPLYDGRLPISHLPPKDFDYSIVNSYYLENGISGGVSKKILGDLKTMDEIESIDPFIIISQFEIGSKVYTIHALPFAENETEENSIFISSNLAFLENLKAGDTLSIPTKLSGSIDFTILGDKEHFFSERGTIIMELALYEKYFGIDSFNSIRIKLKKNVDPELFLHSLKMKFTKEQQLVIFDSEGLKNIYLSGTVFQSSYNEITIIHKIQKVENPENPQHPEHS
jgi:putative ABC transport system permease protein